MSVFPSQGRRWADHQNWFLRHSLSLVLVAILVVQSIAFHFTRLPEWVAEQQAHQESTALWPEYWFHYGSEWFVSVLADTYGALLLVLLTKWFYEAGSAESGGDGDPDADD
jgi:hypothetical protein